MAKPIARAMRPMLHRVEMGAGYGNAFKIPAVTNEPNRVYAKNSQERRDLQAAIERCKKSMPFKVGLPTSLPNAKIRAQHNPSDHSQIVAEFAETEKDEVAMAIRSALDQKRYWEDTPFEDRAAIFLKAADLIAGKYRYDIMAATMLGQGKNAWQAEIDAAAELVDFLRFNVKFAEELYSQQPTLHSPGVWNRLEYRPLEGFVYAITPFNFTAIAGNLPCAPALMGNVVIWKPSDSAMASNWLLYNILLEAGLPQNVIKFVPGDAEKVTKKVLEHKKFAALHFTGSTSVFKSLYGRIAARTAAGGYIGYPRIVGETGGKNFHLIHRTAAVENAAMQTVRGAFEYQGQKCSATSRCYVDEGVWPEFKTILLRETKALKQGSPEEFENFVGPVIHEASFNKLKTVIDAAKDDESLTLLAGGNYDQSKGYFIAPTIYQTSDINHPLLSAELFGPILVVYVYEGVESPSGKGATEREAHNLAAICDEISQSSDYALTGSIFAQDRTAIRHATYELRNAAGNFYINCKSTGAVVGQQPFGGARMSGTNDKAGSMNLLTRFVSVRSIKEEFVETTKVKYPSNEV